MSRLYLVRHGPTHAKAFAGHRDIPADLSDKAALSRLEAALPPDALVISSDLSRAVATADAIQGARERLPHSAALREFDFGLWDGLHHSEVTNQWPDLARAYWEHPGETRPPEGESWNEAAARISARVDRLLADHAGADVVIVAHFGAILTQLQRALGASAYDTLSHKLDNLSLTEIRTKPHWSAVQINHRP